MLNPLLFAAIDTLPPVPPIDVGTTTLINLPLDDPNGTTSPRDLVGIATLTSANGASVTNSILRNGRNTASFTSSTVVVRRFEWPYRSAYDVAAGGSVTIEGWFYPTSLSSNPTYIIQMSGAAPYTLGLSGSNDQWFFAYRDSTGLIRTLTSSVGGVLNTWTHVAGVFTPTRQAIYINGLINATSNTAGSANLVPGNPSSVWRLGGSTFGQQYFGRMSDFRITSGARYVQRRHIVT